MSLSISDGGPVEELFDGVYPLTDTSLWAPSLPAPDIHFLGMDPRHAADPNLDMPITVFTFGSDPRTRGQIRGIEVQYGLGYRGIVRIEVRYADGMPPRRIGRQGEPGDTGATSLFPIDGAHGEYVTGIEAYYWNRGWLFGFRVGCVFRPSGVLWAVANTATPIRSIRVRGVRQTFHPGAEIATRGVTIGSSRSSPRTVPSSGFALERCV